MIVDGKVQVFHEGQWQPVELSKVSNNDGLPVVSIPSVRVADRMSIAQAIEEARAQWRWEQKWGEPSRKGAPRPIRVIDSEGNVVEAWPKGLTNV